MRRSYPGLRTTLTVATIVIAAIALVASMLLIILPTRLHLASVELADAVESVNLANNAKISLLLHGRTKDALVRREIESDLRRILADLGPFVTTDMEARALRAVSERINTYFTESHASSPPPSPQVAVHDSLDVAYAALEALVDVNVRHARGARDRVARLDAVASGIGTATAVALLCASGWFLWWLRARAFRPMFGLLDSIQRFGRGERDVRANEDGPAELHAIARRFNEMAAALAAQRHVQANFLGGVAHDLRNPLSALKLTAASARRTAGSSAETKLQRLADQAERQIGRMERMLGDFLDIARIEAGELDLRVEWQDARALVSEVVELFESVSSSHQLTVDVPDDEVPIYGDPLRLEQVLTNLVSNAIKFSPDGGTVAIKLVREVDEVMFSVADSGIGISEGDRQRLFEPFRRVGPTKGLIPGIGLGLFVVRQIVLAHGGRIEVTSVPKHGTVFQVYLPAEGAHDREPARYLGSSSDPVGDAR